MKNETKFNKRPWKDAENELVVSYETLKIFQVKAKYKF